MSTRKKLNSNVIAGVLTLVIHLALIAAFSFDFGGMASSAKLSDADNEMFLQLEDLMNEDFDITAPGKDPASENEEIASENSNGDQISQQSNQETALIPEEKPVEQIPDTVPKPVEEPVVAQLEVEPITPAAIDSAMAAVFEETKKAMANTSGKKTTTMTNKEKIEFYKKNYRLIRNFQKVYPYALKTREIMQNLNEQLAEMNSESDKRKLIKETEQKLFGEYEGAIRTMSTSQGKLLLKLIARETNRTGYDIIKEYKGAFSATFWYGVGKIFGTDLKTQYDREQKEDSIIETVLEKYNKNELN